MTKKTIVTLSDSNYYPLLEELIHSIRKFKESENISICVLDAGLNSSQVDKSICANLRSAKGGVHVQMERCQRGRACSKQNFDRRGVKHEK